MVVGSKLDKFILSIFMDIDIDKNIEYSGLFEQEKLDELFGFFFFNS